MPPPRLPVLGEDPAERTPIPGVFDLVDAILRTPRRVMFQLRQPGVGGLVMRMGLTVFVCSVVYGVVMGTFSGGDQMWIVPLKVAGGLLASALICLPSLYIFTCLSGSAAKFTEMAGLLAGMLTLMTLLLIGFAPVAWLFSQSTESVLAMGSLHLVFWLIATCFALRFLDKGFANTEASTAAGTASSAGLRVWTVIFLLVVLQMTTALRPLIGTADTILPTQKQFFLGHWADSLDGKSSAQK
jgi:hypothetical protein